MTQDTLLPELTTESIVALSAATGVTPSPLILSQLGFKTREEIEPALMLDVVDRGSRALKMLKAVAPKSEELSETLKKCIVAMGEATAFIVFIRSDQADARVIYTGERDMVDTVSPHGNHSIALVDDATQKELSGFFDEATMNSDAKVTIPMERFQSDAVVSGDENPIVARLIEDDAVDRLVAICNASDVEYKILKWRTVDNGLYEIENTDSDVSFTAISAGDAVDKVLSALNAIEQ